MLVSVENLIGRSATTLRAGVGDFAGHEESVIDTVRALRSDLDGTSPTPAQTPTQTPTPTPTPTPNRIAQMMR
jgi:hypothetical protein